MTPETAPKSARTGLLVAAGLGLTAFAVTVLAQSGDRPPTLSVVRLAAPLTAGKALTEADLEAVPLSDPDGTLKKTAVPWDLRHTAIGLNPRRPIGAGSILHWDDLAVTPDTLPLADNEAALPLSLDGVPRDFRWIRVGDRLTFQIATPGEDGKPAPAPTLAGPFRVIAVADGGTVTVAIPWGPAGAADASASLRAAQTGSGAGPQLMKIILHPVPAHRQSPKEAP